MNIPLVIITLTDTGTIHSIECEPPYRVKCLIRTKSGDGLDQILNGKPPTIQMIAGGGTKLGHLTLVHSKREYEHVEPSCNE